MLLPNKSNEQKRTNKRNDSIIIKFSFSFKLNIRNDKLDVNKKIQKKDLVSIIEDIIQESNYQIDSNISDHKMQELEDVFSLKQFEFQEFIYEFFKNSGIECPFQYKSRKDLGQDGFFIYNNLTYIIQTKTKENTDKPLLVDEIRKFAGVQQVKTDKKIYICNCYVSKTFKYEAELSNILILDRDSLKVLISNKDKFYYFIEYFNEKHNS